MGRGCTLAMKAAFLMPPLGPWQGSCPGSPQPQHCCYLWSCSSTLWGNCLFFFLPFSFLSPDILEAGNYSWKHESDTKEPFEQVIYILFSLFFKKCISIACIVLWIIFGGNSINTKGFSFNWLVFSLIHPLPTVVPGPDSSLIHLVADNLCGDIQSRFMPVLRLDILNRCILYSGLQTTSFHSLF